MNPANHSKYPPETIKLNMYHSRLFQDVISESCRSLNVKRRLGAVKSPPPLRINMPPAPTATPPVCSSNVPLEGAGSRGRSFGGVETHAIENTVKNHTEPNCVRFARPETKGGSETETGGGPVSEVRTRSANPFENRGISGHRWPQLTFRYGDSGGGHDIPTTFSRKAGQNRAKTRD